ncbi:mechanosensitive ion channel family protein [Pseudomonas sp. Marseille-QA0892]
MRLLRSLCLFISCALFHATLSAAPAATDHTVTDADVQRVIDLLQDDQRRADVIAVLKALADPEHSASSAAEASDAPAADEQTTALVPLEEDGLIARTLQQIGTWADGLAQQGRQLRQAAHALPEGWHRAFGSEAGRQRLLMASLGLALVFGAALAAEWAAARPITRLRRRLANAASRDVRLANRPATGNGEIPPGPATAATRPSAEGVALVQTQRNGVEELEAIPVGNTAAAAPPEPTPSETTPPLPSATEHSLGPLRRLVYAAGRMLLELVPVGVFFVVSAIALRLLEDYNPALSAATGIFVNAYLTARVTMIVVRLLVSPCGDSSAVIPMSARLSELLERWTRRFVTTATFGIALAEAASVLGAGADNRVLVLKLTSLLVHGFAVALILHLRRPVADALRPAEDAAGLRAAARRWLAQVWWVFAAATVLGAWLVWAMGVEDGLPRLLGFLAVSGAVLAAGRIAAILAQSALGRLFDVDAPPEETASSFSLQHYYPLARSLTSLLIGLGTLVALFQAWGFNALGWFAQDTIGRSLVSAALTILIAAVGALLIWQWANFAVNQRLQRWTQRGDVLRVARLRTLMPMLRTALFIVISLVVVLTALSQLGINTTPLLAGASIIGVALGFGSQKLVQDFITGIFLLMENAMQVGDWVTVAGVSGTVEYLSIRTVRLRAGDGSLHIVPFSSVSTVNNTNRGIGNAAVRISVGYDVDVEEVIAEIKQIGADLRADPAFSSLILNDIEVWGVDAVDGSMVTVAGQIRCIDKGRWGVQREMNKRILQRFRERQIEIANPRTTLIVPTEPTPPPRERPA